VQQWVAGDMGSMIDYLQQQQAAVAAAGMHMREVRSHNVGRCLCAQCSHSCAHKCQ
jgi:hypothetical protein